MRKVKYVVYEHDSGIETMIVFPGHIGHKEIAEKLGSKILSAGFIDNGKCVGNSDSLGVSSLPEDQEIFDIFLKTGLDQE